ncbi:hypothetical protein D8674_009439 [Pyrus ussuriensis x Pyrus communis]|uniref:Uncharacterized protein n=1 Tax=Pyrus ussuriensis x Pyrus communis TaxID=2448454 RepID=A0A5N5F7Y4_9ROSA|nr:hypothetical protein D8674_009439 [Pyrus ussuriensis x Pyrus communis]
MGLAMRSSELFILGLVMLAWHAAQVAHGQDAGGNLGQCYAVCFQEMTSCLDWCEKNYIRSQAPPAAGETCVEEALMSEFDADNKGDNGDLHTTYTSKGKEDDSESLMCYQTKSRAVARSDIITCKVKGRKLVVELTSQSGVT